uniref:Ig-like domain-containing protein n=1 Tax=Sphenodon punctatus TaxID=8508 RepID=A0A8D0HGS6_SPHPU
PLLSPLSDTPDIPSVSSPQNLNDGSPATFTCSSPYVCPYDTISLRWSGYNAVVSVVSGVTQLDTTGALSQQNLSTSLSWRDHSKKLSCTVSVGSRRAVQETTLSVNYSPKGTKVLINPSAKNIRVGDTASLTCSVNSSYPGVTAYRWYKDGSALANNNQIVTLLKVAREDYGLYSCEAKNAVGTGAAEAMALYVFSVVISISPSAEVREGKMVTLTCDVPGEEKQEINYNWYKNSIRIKEDTARTLTFLEVAVSDSGYYSCEVQNDKGSEM